MQNVGTPRFYMDWGSWLKAIDSFELYGTYSSGHNTWVQNESLSEEDCYSLAGLNPSNVVTAEVVGQSNWGEMTFSSGSLGLKDPNACPNYCAVLGHNFNTSGVRFSPCIDNGENSNGIFDSHSEIVNYIYGASAGGITEFDGFSIGEFSEPNGDFDYFRVSLSSNLGSGNSDTMFLDDVKIGAICYGRYYDMPHSPDLKLKLSYEYDGVKTMQTKNGSTLSNAMYTKPADWGSQGAWQLGGNQNYRTGRRTWDLSFSYLSDAHVFPVNASTSYAATIGSETGYPEGSIIQTTGADTPHDSADDSYGFTSNIVNAHNEETGKSDFFSQVWNKTLGNALPFIFQPDNTNNSTDQFCIAKFVDDTLQYEQVAHNVYNIKLKIEEVW